MQLLSFGSTFLAPGQRYAHPNELPRLIDRQLTVARLDHDPHGLLRVIFRAADGRELTAYAAQIEAAVADGQLTPIVDRGQIARC